MPALAHEIGDDPVLLALLDPPQLQGEQFAAPQPTAQEDGEHRVITSIEGNFVQRRLDEEPSGGATRTRSWPCPRCGAPMRLVEGLTPRQLSSSPPRRRLWQLASRALPSTLSRARTRGHRRCARTADTVSANILAPPVRDDLTASIGPPSSPRTPRRQGLSRFNTHSYPCVRRKRQRLGPNGSFESDPRSTSGLEACVRAGSLPIESYRLSRASMGDSSMNA